MYDKITWITKRTLLYQSFFYLFKADLLQPFSKFWKFHLHSSDTAFINSIVPLERDLMLVLFIPCNLKVGLENEVGFLGGFSWRVFFSNLSFWSQPSASEFGEIWVAIECDNTEKRGKEEKGLIPMLRFNGKRSFFPNFI